MGQGKGRDRPFGKGPAATGRGDRGLRHERRKAPPQSAAGAAPQGWRASRTRQVGGDGGRGRAQRTALEGLEHAVGRARSLGEGHDAVAILPRVRDRVRGRVTVGVDRQLRVRVRVAARVLGRVRVGVRIRELGQGKGRSGLG